ncbi:tRNA-2-methylthio-N(6)-dimethylallyladenosine synthase [Acrasis kona]|uniref:tRNA-2-methylthio-N(6)-dimethylallyladenosine synthase n=1 Tax=Acrasis kona TaxID=1008807 RepID=A0AAW2ZJB9_9EUKA
MNTCYYDMSIDEDVENNYQEDRIPDILNPYLDLPSQTTTESSESDVISYNTYVVARKTRVSKKSCSLKKKPTLFISTN